MQPGVTAVLATVWLTVYLGVVGTTALHPSRLALDQYSPLAPRRHGVYRRVVGQLDWKDPDPSENQPFDLSIGPRRSISTSIESLKQPFKDDEDSIFSRTVNSGIDDFSSLAEDKQSRNFVGGEFTDEKVDDRNTKVPFVFPSHKLPPFELEDPFVADDTFQDQGPGSVEIYKLDLLREKPLLNPTPVTKLLPKNKSKTPKKTSHADWKTKTNEYKATSPEFRKQSNSLDDLSTEMPPDSDPFSVGGVPELQVGCEGLETADHKQKRSIDVPMRNKESEVADFWTDITPISLEMNYDSSVEDAYEEMDELVKIFKLENTTKSLKHRGDMDATHEGEFSNDKNSSETLPVRGDLGSSTVVNDSTVVSTVFLAGNREAKEAKAKDEKDYYFNKAKQIAQDKDGSSADEGTANQGRKILWFDDKATDQQSDNEKRSKRAVWGFEEDEGVVSSDELQTENHRRRQHDERLRQEEERRRQEHERRRQEEARRRGYTENQTNSDIEKIREQYARNLEQRERENEERQRRLQQEAQRTPSNRWQPQDEHRRRVQEDETRRNRWQEEERRRQQLEASRRRYEPPPQTIPAEQDVRRLQESRLRKEERRRQLQEEEMRRREEARKEEEMKRRQQQESDRKDWEERKQQWMLKRKQEQELEERRRQQQSRDEPPANLAYPTHASRNESDERRTREQEERERERKLREYIQRNRPINVNVSAGRQREEAHRRRLEEERRRMEEEHKLQEYIRRNQPIHVPRTNESGDRNWLEYRRKAEEVRPNDRSRYVGPGNGRRNHGPSASTNIDPRSYVDEARGRDAARRIEEERIRERERQEMEQRRKEALRREEEVRRAQSRRYEEQRKRQEAARLEDERRRKELIEEEARRSQAGRRPSQSTRPNYEDRRRFEEHRRRQDTRLIPSNLLLNESRRVVDLERQRQEQERRRIEDERRRQEETRAKEARDHDERARAMKEQWRRQEEARLNKLPVSARIIIRPGGPAPTTPPLANRGGFGDFVFPDPYQNKKEIPVPVYPPRPTLRPQVKGPAACVWAVVQCCPTNNKRLVTCFETAGCPGINWDPNPCRRSILQAARKEVELFYAESDLEKYQ